MSLHDLVAAAMLGALVLYAVLGGADFGGGVWDLLARGPRAVAQRALIERAIAPVWEANHVWLIIVVVILFSGFPSAFAAMAIALHVPLTLLALGIVLRGAAFSFRHYDERGPSVQKRWGRVFAVASLMTPLFLGVVIGAITSGRIHFIAGLPAGGFVRPWLGVFPIAVGLLTLVLFAFVAAVYLSVEAEADARARGAADRDPLVEDFRRRALLAGALVFAAAIVTARLAADEPADFHERLVHGAFTWPVQIATAIVATGALAALALRRYRIARALAAVQVALIIAGWAVAQRPYLIAPDLTLEGAAAPPVTMRLLLGTLAFGSLILLPSLYWLFRVFKRGPGFGALDEEDG